MRRAEQDDNLPAFRAGLVLRVGGGYPTAEFVSDHAATARVRARTAPMIPRQALLLPHNAPALQAGHLVSDARMR